VTSPADAREKVGQLLDSGAEVISIHLGEQPSLSADEVAAIVQVAHGRGVPVAAGVRFSSNQALALDAGVDNASIDGDDELPDEILGRLVKSGLTVVPALEFFTGMGYSYYAKENFRRFVAAGGKVALGTGYTTRLGGMSLGMPIKEMEMMAQAGMTPMQIIVAATLQAARVCHREKDLGTVEAGKIADLLVVKGDPLADLQALTRACLVLRDGVVIRPNHCAQ
jgi:imidazolonepropionase-like amidohydrolase